MSTTQLQARPISHSFYGVSYAHCQRPHSVCGIENSNKGTVLYFTSSLSVKLDSLSSSFTSISFLVYVNQKFASKCKSCIHNIYLGI